GQGLPGLNHVDDRALSQRSRGIDRPGACGEEKREREGPEPPTARTAADQVFLTLSSTVGGSSSFTLHAAPPVVTTHRTQDAVRWGRSICKAMGDPGRTRPVCHVITRAAKIQYLDHTFLRRRERLSIVYAAFRHMSH